MNRKSLRERVDDSIDYMALGLTALVGIGIVLLRGRIASRLKKRYGDSDEYDSFGNSCDTDAGRSDDYDPGYNKR
jgi:hypothetical protein